MKFLQPAVVDELAWRQLHRRRFDGICTLFRSSARLWRRNGEAVARAVSPQRNLGELPYLELLWLPSYRIQFDAVRGDSSVFVEALVGGNERTFAVWDFSDARWVESAERHHFSATIDASEALLIARQGLLDSVLRRVRWGRKTRILPDGRIELVQYPYWVYYFERRADKLDFRMLDGITGRPAGSKVKIALLTALRSHDSAKTREKVDCHL